MPKRQHDTAIWNEDWFIELPTEYKVFFFWIKDACDHAGVWKANKAKFEIITKMKVNIKTAIELYNSDKERFIKVNGNKYLYRDFYVFQYGTIMNLNSHVHRSIAEIYCDLEVNLRSIRGLFEVKLGSIDIDIDIYNIKALKEYIIKIKTKKKEVYKKEKEKGLEGNSRIKGDDPDGY